MRVNEYIVGVGPPRITVILHGEQIGHYLTLEPHRNPEDWATRKDTIIEELDDPRARTAEAFEGKELVLFLQPSPTLAVEAWEVASHFHMWFVQRGGDVTVQQVGAEILGGDDLETTVTTPNGSSDEVRVVAQAILWAANDEQRNKLNIPLSQLEREVKKAAERRTVATGGRIGVDATLPMLATDANRLRNYYEAVGAVYEGDEATVVVPGVPLNVGVSESWVVSWDPPDRGGEAHWYRLELRFTSRRVLLFTGYQAQSANIAQFVSDYLGEDLELRVRSENFSSGRGEWTDALTYTNISSTAPTTSSSTTTTAAG